MKKYGIVVDSTFYFTGEELERMNIKSVSLNIIDGEKSFKESEVENKYVRDLLNNGHKLTTSQPSPGEFLKVYEDFLNDGCDKVFVLTLSKPLSGTYQSAKLAHNMMQDQSKVHLFESTMASFGNENLTLRLFELIEEGLEFEAIVSQMEKFVKSAGLVISVENLISLFKSGRLSRTKAAIGTVLRVKPIIRMEEGKLNLYKSFRSHKKVMVEMIDEMKKNVDGWKKIYVRIQSKNNLEQAKVLEQLVKDQFENAVVTVNEYLGPVFSIHIGTKGYGLSWCGE